jgi:hypothetical protein
VRDNERQPVDGPSTKTASSYPGKHSHGSQTAADYDSSSKAMNTATDTSTVGEPSCFNTTSPYGTVTQNGLWNVTFYPATTWSGISGARTIT